jgi:LysM repeat protein
MFDWKVDIRCQSPIQCSKKEHVAHPRTLLNTPLESFKRLNIELQDKISATQRVLVTDDAVGIDPVLSASSSNVSQMSSIDYSVHSSTSALWSSNTYAA